MLGKIELSANNSQIRFALIVSHSNDDTEVNVEQISGFCYARR